MILGWLNRADAAMVAAGSEIATLPASNVQQPHLSRKWHTAAGVKASYLLLDMLAAASCSLLAVLGSNLTAAATLRLRASTADPTAVAGDLLDTGTISAGVKTGYGAIYRSFTAVAARYWRLDLADASLPDNLQIGRVFLGPKWVPSSNQEFGWSVTPLDDSAVVESYGFQTYGDERPQRRLLQFSLSWMTEAEMYGNAFALARASGRVRDVLAVNDTLGSTYLSEQSVYGLLQAAEPLVHESAQIFRQKFIVKERL